MSIHSTASLNADLQCGRAFMGDFGQPLLSRISPVPPSLLLLNTKSYSLIQLLPPTRNKVYHIGVKKILTLENTYLQWMC